MKVQVHWSLQSFHLPFPRVSLHSYCFYHVRTPSVSSLTKSFLRHLTVSDDSSVDSTPSLSLVICTVIPSVVTELFSSKYPYHLYPFWSPSLCVVFLSDCIQNDTSRRLFFRLWPSPLLQLWLSNSVINNDQYKPFMSLYKHPTTVVKYPFFDYCVFSHLYEYSFYLLTFHPYVSSFFVFILPWSFF